MNIRNILLSILCLILLPFVSGTTLTATITSPNRIYIIFFIIYIILFILAFYLKSFAFLIITFIYGFFYSIMIFINFLTPITRIFGLILFLVNIYLFYYFLIEGNH